MDIQPELMEFYTEGCILRAADSWLKLSESDPAISTRDDERANILFCVKECAAHRRFDWVARFWSLTEQLYNHGYWNEYEQLEQECLAAAKELGDLRMQADIFNELGYLAHDRDQLVEAERYIQTALRLYTELGSERGMFIARRYLALIALRAGDHTSAREQLESLLEAIEPALPAAEGDLKNSLERQAITIHGTLGSLLLKLGDYENAEREMQLGLEGADRFSKTAKPTSLLEFGKLRIAQGRLEEASELLQESLDLCRIENIPSVAAGALSELAEIAKLCGDREAARNLAQQAWKIYHALGSHGCANQVSDFLSSLA